MSDFTNLVHFKKANIKADKGTNSLNLVDLIFAHITQRNTVEIYVVTV